MAAFLGIKKERRATSFPFLCFCQQKSGNNIYYKILLLQKTKKDGIIYFGYLYSGGKAMKIGLLGFGSMGKTHAYCAENLRYFFDTDIDVKITKVCTRNIENAKKACEKLQPVLLYHIKNSTSIVFLFSGIGEDALGNSYLQMLLNGGSIQNVVSTWRNRWCSKHILVLHKENWL